MPMIRVVLLLMVLGGLTLLLAQNWLPVLPLVFLGVRTPALPLAIWILISVAAGAFTFLFVTGLFQLSNYFSRSLMQKRRNKVVKDSSTQQSQHTEASRSSKPDTDSAPSDALDDWDSDSTDDDDWGFEEDADKTQNSSSQNTVRDSTTYEASTEPKSGYRSGSVYSYSYREPSNSGVGKTESVYDADYRVIVPPYQKKDPTGEKEEDWGFEDEDDNK